MISITILSTLLGIFGSALPNIIDIFKSKQDTQNDIKLLEAKSDYNVQVAKLNIVQLNTEADIRETESIHANDAALDGGKFINAVRASVRPFITYVFFSLFIFIKAYAVYHGLTIQGLEVINLLPLIWDEDTAAIFSAVIGFWFGDRAINNYYKRKNRTT